MLVAAPPETPTSPSVKFVAQSRRFTRIKFLRWSLLEFLFFFLSNWQKKEALCDHWSLTRGPPSFTKLQPNYPQNAQSHGSLKRSVD